MQTDDRAKTEAETLPERARTDQVLVDHPVVPF
jgi:hypothetical protein